MSPLITLVFAPLLAVALPALAIARYMAPERVRRRLKPVAALRSVPLRRNRRRG